MTEGGSDTRWTWFNRVMLHGLTEAEHAADQGEVPVGAVVVAPTGAIIGVGRNDRESAHDPTGHAEVVAIRQAARARGDWRLTGCTLAVTLEPCAMCAGAMVQARIRVLVYGARDPKAGAAGSLWDIVRDPRLNHQLEVIPPDLLPPETANRCSRLLFSFFSARRLR